MSDIYARYRCTTCARMVQEALPRTQEALDKAREYGVTVSLLCAKCSWHPNAKEHVRVAIAENPPQMIGADGGVL